MSVLVCAGNIVCVKKRVRERERKKMRVKKFLKGMRTRRSPAEIFINLFKISSLLLQFHHRAICRVIESPGNKSFS
jgi:hypothetical protein